MTSKLKINELTHPSNTGTSNIVLADDGTVAIGGFDLTNPSTDDVLVYDGSVWAGVNSTTQTKADLNATGDAPVYACRAWVNFRGTDTVIMRASGNVSSVLDNGGGDYTVNFATAMPDVNYAVTTVGSYVNATGCLAINHATAPSTTAVRLIHGHFVAAGATGFPSDATYAHVAIFR